jgi:hypothetical protein
VVANDQDQNEQRVAGARKAAAEEVVAVLGVATLASPVVVAAAGEAVRCRGTV